MKNAIQLLGYCFACNLLIVGAALSAPLHEIFDAMVEELRVIGLELQAYKADHDNQLPHRLTDLVSQGYLTNVNPLVSIADLTLGSEGGIPDSYSWNQFSETDENESSFMYEFSEAICSWMPGYGSWADVKYHQMEHGDSLNEGPYDPRSFPVVRNFWFGYPVAISNHFAPTVLNLAYDLETVFASQPYWEADQHGHGLDDPVQLRDPLLIYPHATNDVIDVNAGVKFQFPLWPKVATLTDPPTYLLLETEGQVVNDAYIEGNILYWLPIKYRDTNAAFKVQMTILDLAITNKVYQVHVADTFLQISQVFMGQDNNLIIGWDSTETATYSLDSRLTLTNEWDRNIFVKRGTGETLFYTNNVHESSARFFRVRAEIDEWE